MNLLLRNLTSEEVSEPKLPERETRSGRAHELFKTLENRTEKAGNEFVFRMALIVNRFGMQIDFTKIIGLKKRMWKK